MTDLSRYDDATGETWPNMAPLPPEAFMRQVIPAAQESPKHLAALDALKSVAPFLLSGLVLGLLPLSVGFWLAFLVDYWELGGLMYAWGVVGGALLTGVVAGVVGCLCLRRIR